MGRARWDMALYPRRGARLRRLARSGLRWLGLGKCAASVQDLEQNTLGQASVFRGIKGEMLVSRPTEPNVVCNALIAAGEALQRSHNTDFNGPSQNGLGAYDMTPRNGRRFS